MQPRRRKFLLASLAATGAAAAAWRFWPEQGFANPCRPALPARLARHDIVLKRHLRSRGKRLSRRVFETRPFFAP